MQQAFLKDLHHDCFVRDRFSTGHNYAHSAHSSAHSSGNKTVLWMKVSGGIDGGQEVGLEAITTVLPVFEDIPMQGGGQIIENSGASLI